MRRLRLTLLLALCLHLSLATPSFAFWRWLDELSGPGSFNGIEVEARLKCFRKPDGPTRDAAAAAAKRKPDQRPTTRDFAGGLLLPGCLADKDQRLDKERKGSFNLEASFLWARKTNLVYADNNQHHSVKAMSVRPTFWLRPTRSVEFGAGVSLYRFYGSSFDAFTRVAVEPFLLDVKPIALARDILGRANTDDIRDHPDAQGDLALSVRFGLVYFPKGFDAEDFGAVPGTFHTGKELLPSVSVLLDLDPMFRRRAAKR